MGRMIRTKTVVHVTDLAAESAYIEQREPGIVAAVEIGSVRTLLAVPMLDENGLIGAILLAAKKFSHLLTSRSSSCRTSLPMRSSPLRIHAC